MIDVAIIGAGPYGLSIAAYLGARGIEFRIFGSPMQTWLTNMPKGMRLKSEGFASSLYDADASFTLAHYCKQEGIPYADIGLPVHLETFCSYGLAFQRRFVPEVENRVVVSVARCNNGFRIEFANGEVIKARRVIAAVGLTHFAYVPPILSELPRDLVSHSSRHQTLDGFRGREVAVIGGGASAADVSALLHEGGATTHLVARRSVIRFHNPPEIPRPLWRRIRYPVTGIGTGWEFVFYTQAPPLFRLFPERLRIKAVRQVLGPAPGWFVKNQVVGRVSLHLDATVTRASVQNGRVNLQLTNSAGDRRTLVTDHVISATGYRVDLRRLGFLDPNIQEGIQSVEHSPVLSSNFESSIPGLYFVGTSAANTFGPMLRFAFGAGFAARRISRHLSKSASKAA
jgi:cation diffusion facilitator CzcD-associated flavoprotein CzcO